MAKRSKDEILVYFSHQDQVWLAHSFRTDQIGCGNCVLVAIESLLRGIKTIMEMKKDDPSIEVWREAPPEVQARAKNAKLLPYEFVEIAHHRVHGTWPKELPLESNPSEKARFAGKLDLASCL
jgi:hypothetical protein